MSKNGKPAPVVPNAEADDAPVSGACMNEGMERLAIAFERSARRWEMIIYPVMIIFTLFAAYGFFQIYTVTRDLRAVAAQIEPQMGVHMTRLTLSMQNLTNNIADMSTNIQTMQTDISKMSNNMASMTGDIQVMSTKMKHLQSMDRQMVSMNRSMNLMANNTNRMQWDMAKMNHSIGKPMNFMNSFMPW